MVQKTYQIYNFENGAFEQVLQEVLAMPAYCDAKQVLLVVYEQNWDQKKILWKTGQIKKILPKVEIVGINHRNAWDPVELKKECSILSFLFFENIAFTIHRYDLVNRTDREIGRALREDIKAQKQVKGAMIFLSEFYRDLDEMLEEAEKGIEDIPIFGAPSASSTLYTEQGNSYVFLSDECYENYMLAVIFYGKELHLKISYNYGWTPVGKQMTITKMDGKFHVLEIDHKPAAEIYKKYLGVESANAIMANCCEFPIIIEKEGVTIARIPAGCYPDNSLQFAAPLKEGDHIRFSYGVVDEIQSEVYYDSYNYRFFVPQGMFLIVCMNRVIFLKDLESLELDYYKQFASELSYLHGNSEIYRYHGEGGELNSALIAIGFREGEPGKPHDFKYGVCDLNSKEAIEEKMANLSGQTQKFQIPLEYRVMNFMRAVTVDLEDLAEEAHTANQAKSIFLSNMSHEIRTPINAVLGLNEMILRESSEKQVKDYAMDIQSAGNTLLTLINDLLDVTKIESGKMEIIPERYDLSSMIHDLVQMTMVRAKKKNLHFEVEVSETLPSELFGDDVRVKQVLTNILTNAVKYTPEGSVYLRIDGHREGNKEILHCEVEDTGIGIKEEDIPKLFEAFQRIEEKKNRHIEGTGLGMNITHQLLDMMGSHLEVESVYGKGSKFWFELEQKIMNDMPIGNFESRIQHFAGEYHYEPSFEAPDAKILVVDDNELNLKVFCNLLKQTKVKITPVTSGKECLAIAKRKQFDVIFLDHMMPEMDGLEILKKLRQMRDSKNIDTPVYALTANAAAGAKESYLAAGFKGFLSKPIDIKKLEKMIRTELPPEKIDVLV